MRVRTLTAMLVLASVWAACGGDDDGFAPADPGPGDPAPALSMVVLGDSVAAGEGINYGYTYCSDCSPERWTGGTDDPA